MISNVFYLIGVILLILMVLAIAGVVGFSWILCLVGALIAFIIGYFFRGR